MKRFCYSLLLLAALAPCSSASAQNWIFRPSYYTHDPATDVRIGRQFSTGPVFTRSQGDYVKTGFRNVRSTITTQGQTYDNLQVWESWIQTGSKF